MSKSKKDKKHLSVEYEDDGQTSSKRIKTAPNKNWEMIIENIKVMRKATPAPVDTMGCEKCANEEDDEPTQRFQILVALMLSSQTKDAVTFAACQRLHKRGFTPQNIAGIDLEELQALLTPVGFYKTKAKHIKATSQLILDEHEGDIPEDLPGLLKLPGVGMKMAQIAMNEAWGKVTGIGVDVHVHRIANRLKFVTSKNPEETRVQLESWLPREHWNDFNLLMVGFGQTICLPTKPKCSECLNNKICPSAFQ